MYGTGSKLSGAQRHSTEMTLGVDLERVGVRQIELTTLKEPMEHVAFVEHFTRTLLWDLKPPADGSPARSKTVLGADGKLTAEARRYHPSLGTSVLVRGCSADIISTSSYPEATVRQYVKDLNKMIERTNEQSLQAHRAGGAVDVEHMNRINSAFGAPEVVALVAAARTALLRDWPAHSPPPSGSVSSGGEAVFSSIRDDNAWAEAVDWCAQRVGSGADDEHVLAFREDLSTMKPEQRQAWLVHDYSPPVGIKQLLAVTKKNIQRATADFTKVAARTQPQQPKTAVGAGAGPSGSGAARR
jgi:hypothetical protein